MRGGIKLYLGSFVKLQVIDWHGLVAPGNLELYQKCTVYVL